MFQDACITGGARRVTLTLGLAAIALVGGGAAAQSAPALTAAHTPMLLAEMPGGDSQIAPFKDHRSNKGKWSKPTPGVFQGALARSIDTYTGKELVDLYGRTNWFGWERKRACRNPASCGTTRKARMLIQAIGDANEIAFFGAPTSADPNGIVFGMLRNTGGYMDSTTGIPGGQTVPNMYFLVIERRASAPPVLKVAKVTFDVDGVPNPDLEITVSTDSVYSCKGDGHPKRKYPQGDFATCTMAGPSDSLTSSTMSAMAKSTSVMSIDASMAGPWFSCSEGCCITANPPFERVEWAKAHRDSARSREPRRTSPTRPQ